MDSPKTSKQALAALWRHAGQPDAALEAVTLTGAEPALPSSFAVGTAAQTSIAAVKNGAIVGMDQRKTMTGDLARDGAARYAQLAINGNRVR